MLHFSLDVFRLAARDAVSFLTTLLGPSVPEAILAELTYRGHLKPVSQCVIEAIIDLGGLKRTALNVDIVTLDQTHRAVKVLEAEDPDGLAPTARLQELEVEAIAEHAAKLYRKRTLGDSPRDTDAMKRIAQFFAKVVPEGLDQIRRIVEGPSTVNDKLLALEQLGVIGGEGGLIFSANELAYLLGVDPSTIKKTAYWRRLMDAKREHENQAVEESTRKHRDRAKITETFPSTGD